MARTWWGGATLPDGAGEPIGEAAQWMPIGSSVRMGATDSGHDTAILITARVTGTIADIYVRVLANSWASGGSYQLRLRNQNGGSPTYQATTIVVSDGATGHFSDLTSVLTVTAGEEYEWEWTRTGGGSGTMNVQSLSYAMTPAIGSVFQWNSGERFDHSDASATLHIYVFGDNESTVDINSMRAKLRVSGTVTHFGVRVFSNSRATDTTFRLQKNGSDIGDGITFAGGTTGFVEDAGSTFPESCAVDDYLSASITTGAGGGTISYTCLTVTFAPTVSECQCGVTGGQSVYFGTTEYFPIIGEAVRSVTVDGDAAVKAPFPMALDRFIGFIRTNSLSGGSAVLHIRKNGVNERTITWSATTGEAAPSDSSPLQVVAGDLLDVAFVCGGVSGSAEFRTLTYRVTEIVPVQRLYLPERLRPAPFAPGFGR